MPRAAPRGPPAAAGIGLGRPGAGPQPGGGRAATTSRDKYGWAYLWAVERGEWSAVWAFATATCNCSNGPLQRRNSRQATGKVGVPTCACPLHLSEYASTPGSHMHVQGSLAPPQAHAQLGVQHEPQHAAEQQPLQGGRRNAGSQEEAGSGAGHSGLNAAGAVWQKYPVWPLAGRAEHSTASTERSGRPNPPNKHRLITVLPAQTPALKARPRRSCSLAGPLAGPAPTRSSRSRRCAGSECRQHGW